MKKRIKMEQPLKAPIPVPSPAPLYSSISRILGGRAPAVGGSWVPRPSPPSWGGGGGGGGWRPSYPSYPSYPSCPSYPSYPSYPSWPSYPSPSLNRPPYGGGGGGGLGTGAIIAIVIVAFVVIAAVIAFFCFKNCRKSKEVGDFNELVKSEQESISKEAKEVIEAKDPSIVPKDGLYLFSFGWDGEIITGKAKLTFEDNGRDGYNIDGLITSENGGSKIKQGFAAYNGRAYWVDECTESTQGNFSTRVLSKGTFDFAKNTFMGSWMASTCISGGYTSFYHMNDGFTVAASTPVAPPGPYFHTGAAYPSPQPAYHTVNAAPVTAAPFATVAPVVPVVPVAPPLPNNEQDIEVVAQVQAVVVPNRGKS